MNDSGLDEVFPKEKDWNFYFGVAITSFSLCLFLFHFVSPRFSCIVSSSYHQLSLAKRLDWDTRIGSNLHAVIASAIGLYCFTFDTEARLRDHTFIVQAYWRCSHCNSSSDGDMGLLFCCGVWSPTLLC